MHSCVFQSSSDVTGYHDLAQIRSNRTSDVRAATFARSRGATPAAMLASQATLRSKTCPHAQLKLHPGVLDLVTSAAMDKRVRESLCASCCHDSLVWVVSSQMYSNEAQASFRARTGTARSQLNRRATMCGLKFYTDQECGHTGQPSAVSE